MHQDHNSFMFISSFKFLKGGDLTGRTPISHDYIFPGEVEVAASTASPNQKHLRCIVMVLQRIYIQNVYMKKSIINPYRKGRVFSCRCLKKYLTLARVDKYITLGPAMFLVRQPSQNSRSPHVAQHHLFEECDDMGEVILNQRFWWFYVIGLKAGCLKILFEKTTSPLLGHKNHVIQKSCTNFDLTHNSHIFSVHVKSFLHQNEATYLLVSFMLLLKHVLNMFFARYTCDHVCKCSKTFMYKHTVLWIYTRMLFNFRVFFLNPLDSRSALRVIFQCHLFLWLFWGSSLEAPIQKHIQYMYAILRD